MRNSVLWPLLASTAVLCRSALAEASDEPLPAAVQERLDMLERKVRLLERRLEVDQEAKLADKAKQTATLSAGADGFALKSLDNGTWGALELAYRYSELNLDQGCVPDSANSFADLTTAAEAAAAWAVGFNWYLNNHLKFVLDYEQTDFEGGGGGTAASPPDREDEKVLLSRIQLNF